MRLHLKNKLELSAHEQVVVYFDCPNELSAALVSRELGRMGFRNVRPLAGGFEAWRALGRAVELPATSGISEYLGSEVDVPLRTRWG